MTNKTREIIQQEALQALIDNNGGCVVLGTGSGKSKVGIDYLKQVKATNILITSPRTNLKDNWANELEKWGIYRNSPENPASYIYNKVKCFISIINIQTCYKWSKEQIKGFDLILQDEIHTMVSEEYGKLAINAKELNIPVIGLTGTPDDNKYSKKLFYQNYCPIVYRYLDSAKDGIINKRKYIIYEHTLTDDIKIEVKAGKKSWRTGELKQYQYLEKQINKGKQAIEKVLNYDPNSGEYVNHFGISQKWYFDKTLKDKAKKQAAGLYMRSINYRQDLLWNLKSTSMIAQRLAYHIQQQEKESKVLVFSARTEQANKISKYCVHSKNKEEVNTKYLEDFNKGIIKQLGSCYSLTLGLNLNNAKYGIMESYNGSDVQYKQKGGRLDRLPADEDAILVFIIIKDTQGERWFNNAVQFDDEDIITNVNSIEEFKQILNEYNK